MKATLIECDSVFCIGLEAENLQEAALMTRFAMNRSNEIQSAGTGVSKEGLFHSWANIRKKKNETAYVVRTK